MSGDLNIHATCLTIEGHGILLSGPSGAGKSDLALRLIDQSAPAGSHSLQTKLVADDRVLIERCGNQLFASAPASLKGRLEVRGLGIIEMPYEDRCRLDLFVILQSHLTIERLPDAPFGRHQLAGLDLPMIRLDGTAASAPARIRLALQLLAPQAINPGAIPYHRTG